MEVRYKAAFRRSGRVFLVIAVAILLSVAAYRTTNTLFELKTIEVVGGDVAVEVDQQKLPKNLLFFPVEPIRKRLLNDNPQLMDIEIRKKFPHTLSINPKFRNPIVRLTMQDRSLLLDDTGVVVGFSSDSHDLPTLEVPVEKVRVGEKIVDPRIQTSISFINSTQSFLTLENIVIHDGKSMRARAMQTDILFPQETDTIKLGATLQTLIEGFRIKGILPTIIDLRFDKPIIRY